MHASECHATDIMSSIRCIGMTLRKGRGSVSLNVVLRHLTMTVIISSDTRIATMVMMVIVIGAMMSVVYCL